MKLTVSVMLKARGGWDARVVWIRTDRDGFYAVHRPGVVTDLGFYNKEDESAPVYHRPDGTAASAFAVSGPPAYDGHPADLEMEGYEL